MGIVAVYDESGQFLYRASGTLLSPTVFLTAGHVTYGATRARVSFDPDLSDIQNPSEPWVGHEYVDGTLYTHPSFDQFATFPNTSDVGIIVLSKPVYLNEYGQLPNIGLLDALATKRGPQDTTFTIVGYGYQSVKPLLQIAPVRYKGTTTLVNLSSHLTDGYNLQTSNNPGKAQGTGGTCFGDSGGPVLLGSTNVVVGITSFGANKNCKGVEFAYRTDIANAQDFITSFPSN